MYLLNRWVLLRLSFIIQLFQSQLYILYPTCVTTPVIMQYLLRICLEEDAPGIKLLIYGFLDKYIDLP